MAQKIYQETNKLINRVTGDECFLLLNSSSIDGTFDKF